MVFGRNKKEKEQEEAYMRDMALADQQKMSPDYMDQMGRFQAMLKDEQVTYTFWKHKLLKKTLPARTHLNRTGNYDERDKRIQLLQYQGLNLLMMMHMDEEDYEQGGMLLAEACDIFDYNMVCDNYQGWKARVSTELVKRIETTVEKKKKGLFG